MNEQDNTRFMPPRTRRRDRAESGPPAPSGREVLLLGVKGSGKTVFLSVLGKRFEQEGPLGLCLVPEAGTATDDFVTEVSLRLSEGRFPAATGRSERMLLRWTVNSGRRTLFSLSSMDCAGETILDAFCAPPEGDDDVPKMDDDDLLVTHSGRSEKDVAATLRDMASRAAAICLVLNPNDFPSNARRAVQEDPVLKRDFEERFKAMRRLSLAIAQNPEYSSKTLFVLLTQVGDEAIRSGLESTGDPASYVEAEFPALLRSAPQARCLAVSAVNEVEEEVDERSGRAVLVPAHGFTSSGLAEFLVRVGGELSADLAGVSSAWNALREAERADSQARASVRHSDPDRLAAASARLAAAETLAAECRAFLDADPSRPDPAGRTEEELEPILAAARRRCVAEMALDAWLRRQAVSRASGADSPGAGSPDRWRDVFREVLDAVNDAVCSACGPDAAFSGDRFWGVADPEWLRREADAASRHLVSDLGALADALSARDGDAADRMYAACAAKWQGAPGLESLAAGHEALAAELAKSRAAEAAAAAAADAKEAAAARRRRIVVRAVAAVAATATFAFGWHSARGKRFADARRTWDEAGTFASEGRFSDAVAHAGRISDVPFLLFRRSDVVDEAEVERWRDVPADYASRVAKAVKARDDVVGLKLALERDFSSEDLRTEKVGEFTRAVAAVASAMPGPDLVNGINLPNPGVDPAGPAAAFTNATAKALVAWNLHDAARESASRRRAERFAAEDAIRRAASNAVERLEARIGEFRGEFSAEDRTGGAAKALEASLAEVRRLLGDATASGSPDRFRAIPAAVEEAGAHESAATAEAVAARKARQAAEAEARAAAIAAKADFEKRRDAWLGEFSAADRTGAEAARAEAVYANALAAFEEAGRRTAGITAAYDESVKEFGRAARSLESAVEESRGVRQRRLAEEETARRRAEEAEKRRLAEEEAAKRRAEEAEKRRLAEEEAAKRKAEEERRALLAAVAAAVSKGEVPVLPSSPDERAAALERWRDVLLERADLGASAPPRDVAALDGALRLLEPYFRAAGVDPADETSADPLSRRARAWSEDWSEKAAQAADRCGRDAGAKDFGWKKALECEALAALVEGNPCSSVAARSRGAEAVSGLPGFFVVAATSGGKPVGLPDKVKTPGKTANVDDPATGVAVALCRLDAGTTPILRFVRHLGGERVPGVPRLSPGTNRFTVEFAAP